MGSTFAVFSLTGMGEGSTGGNALSSWVYAHIGRMSGFGGSSRSKCSAVTDTSNASAAVPVHIADSFLGLLMFNFSLLHDKATTHIEGFLNRATAIVTL